MLDVPKDIPEDLETAKKPEKQTPAQFGDDISIADLGEPSIMDDDPTVRQLLAEQMKPHEDPDEIPEATRSTTPVSVAQLAPPPSILPAVPAPASPLAARPTVPDFRGKSMRSVVEESAARGINVMIEGSGVARAQLPLPGSPLRQGEQIRIVFSR
jgi:hypothetical protein